VIDGRALLKKYILLKLEKVGGVAGTDVGDLRKNFGLSRSDVSNRQFLSALGSLHRDHKVTISRPNNELSGISDNTGRPYSVLLR